MKILTGILATLAIALIPVGAAQAANETVKASVEITERSTGVFKQALRPVDLRIHAEVIPETTSNPAARVNPLKNVRIAFPKDMTFVPNDKLTPPCTDAKLGPNTPLSNPSAVVGACANSVIGTGVSTILLAKIPNAVLDDPILVVFNAGRDGQGNPKIKIYGYSKRTTVGILMIGALKNGILDIAVPPLSQDSAVKFFTIDIPGAGLNRPEIGVVTKGRDAKYVQAKCSTGKWITNADFVLGERDESTGQPTGPSFNVKAPQTEQSCVGKAGKGKLAKAKVKGPKAVKKGKKAVYRVSVTNTGTAAVRAVKVTAAGAAKGAGKGGNIAPGKTKVVRVKAKVAKTGVIKFKIAGKGGKVNAKFKVRAK